MAGLVKDWREGDPARDPEDWLERAPEFSRSLVTELRAWILEWEPDLTESMKWSALCFEGRKLVCALCAFKKHAGLTFFRGVELNDPAGLLTQGEGNISTKSIRFTTLDGVNREALRRLLHAATRLDDEPPLPRPAGKPRAPLPLPDALAEALRANKEAAAGFARMTPSAQREYIAWVTFAKRPETQAKRLEETLRAVAAGKRWAQRKNA